LKGPEGINLLWKTMQLTTYVKYLGLTTDKGLTWKRQLKNVIRLTGFSGPLKGTLGV
jgi:hypothetical protein